MGWSTQRDKYNKLLQFSRLPHDARGSASGGAAAVPVAPSSSGHGVGPYSSGSGPSTSSQ